MEFARNARSIGMETISRERNRRAVCGWRQRENEPRGNQACWTEPTGVGRKKMLNRGAFAKNPGDRLGMVAENANAGFAQAFTKHFKHPGQPKDDVTTDQDGAASVGQENGALGEPTHIVWGELHVSDLS